MTHSLEDLKSGKLIGVKTLKLACGLTEFPEEILLLANTLEVLDLSDNQLSALPKSITQLKKLKILFCARNKFTVFPQVLSELPDLNMIGFKTNQIHTVPENAFPPMMNWLILSENKIKSLPKSIGDCNLLQKCALAGNLITELPMEMARCFNLELLRISANKLDYIPDWLFELPKLSWVATGGNPASYHIRYNNDLDHYHWDEFTIQELLGEGASGIISKANWKPRKKEVAIKVFKGDVTSDGLPEDEMEVSIAAGNHENLIPILGKITGHPEEKNGLIMKLIPPTFVNLGTPPNFQTCTRDVFDENTLYSMADLLEIAKSMASVCSKLHRNGINHGDFYAHNILVNENAQSILGDFGAASFYDVTSNQAKSIERVEVRAFGCLLEDLLGLVQETEMNSEIRNHLQSLVKQCMEPIVRDRPGFSAILKVLGTF